MTMLRVFWDAAASIDPTAPHEGRVMPYCTASELEQLWRETGLADIHTDAFVVERTYVDFEDFWEPFTFGVGPGGAYCASLDDERAVALRQECYRRLDEPAGGFTLTARAWFVRGSA